MLFALRTNVDTEGAPLSVRSVLNALSDPPTTTRTAALDESPLVVNPPIVVSHEHRSAGRGVGLRAEMHEKWMAAREASAHLSKNNGCRGC
jgi:hypothetical protein